jgi:hypothetical protein
VDGSRDAERAAGIGPAATGRFRRIAKILMLDVAAPLATYNLLRSAGMATVTALVLSGVVPALGVAAGIVRHRHLEVIGALVLTGIIVGTVLGLVTHSPKLVLMEGSVPTVVFGVACLGSLLTRHPLMFSFALDFVGPDSPHGREMIRLRDEGYGRVFRTITVVWGVGFLLEAAVRVLIVYGTSTGVALTSSKVTPFVWAGALSAWTFAYGAYLKKKGERLAADTATQANGAQSQSADPEGR